MQPGIERRFPTLLKKFVNERNRFALNLNTIRAHLHITCTYNTNFVDTLIAMESILNICLFNFLNIVSAAWISMATVLASDRSLFVFAANWLDLALVAAIAWSWMDPDKTWNRFQCPFRSYFSTHCWSANSFGSSRAAALRHWPTVVHAAYSYDGYSRVPSNRVNWRRCYCCLNCSNLMNCQPNGQFAVYVDLWRS